ncbi:MAG: response regulator transcription factor [Saprospiraceae bacterium]|nr:response regulator transcription factor [Saprospiraceae bacterium]
MIKGIKILVIDDEADTLDFICYQLKNVGFEVKSALNGREALDILREFEPRLILVDYMMPEMDGMSFLRHFKSSFPQSKTKVAFLTAKTDDQTQINVLDTGADDFIAKPIRPNVLLSRIQAILRRDIDVAQANGNAVLQLGDLKIDPEAFQVYVSGRPIDFPRKEFQLLYLLAEKPGKVFKREEILNKVWGQDVLVGERTIDVHIRKIRERLDDKYIKTIKGIGYKLEF